MNRQVGEGVSVVDGVYPEKELVKVTSLEPVEYGKLLAGMTKVPKGKDENGKETGKILNFCPNGWSDEKAVTEPVRSPPAGSPGPSLRFNLLVTP